MALSKYGGRRFTIMTTSCSESFNGVLKEARALPIQAFIIRTFFRLVTFFHTRREKVKNWKSPLTLTNEGT